MTYISGKITGDANYREKFRRAENKLREAGHDVINPVTWADHLDEAHHRAGLPPPTWQEYMRNSLDAISGVDTMYMLHDWQDSRGARLEHHIAQELEMAVLYEADTAGGEDRHKPPASSRCTTCSRATASPTPLLSAGKWTGRLSIPTQDMYQPRTTL